MGCRVSERMLTRPARPRKNLNMHPSKNRWLVIPLASLFVATALPHFAIAAEPALAIDAESTDDQFFEQQVAPLLVMHCLECHQEKTPSGGLSLATQNGLLRGGDSGASIDEDDPKDSSLLARIHDGEMPPIKQGRSQKLDDDVIATFEAWLLRGAPWPENRRLELYERTSAVRAGRNWWSLTKITRPSLPADYANNDSSAPAINAIDAFIGAKLRSENMKSAPRAEKALLLRRAYYDVIGLPPNDQQVAAFLADDSPDAWEKVVDDLLQTPQYGQRWARHWLDVVRFAETSGYERDQEKAFAWKYRDWVIQSLNEDKPYDRFVLEQLAGDELPERNEQTVIATGMLRLGTWNDEPNDPEDYVYDRLEDLVHVTSTAFLGMTVKCARCHDHKFDPIYQEDYYRMAGAFWAGPIAARDREWLGGPNESELGIANVLGWTDITNQPSPLRLLKNGERDQAQQEVAPGTLSMITDLSRDFAPVDSNVKTTQRRLRLAEWIIDPANPLTARVIVNRLWLHYFGQGLVRTPNNFGFTGEQPTHPELLDWLATELMDNSWRLKPLHKLMLMSETYCQSTLNSEAEQYNLVDAGNRFWWRAERRRLDAEALRDTLLFASGELDQQLGGPSFRETVSPEALEGLSQKSAAWTASPESEQHRRSIYMFTKRGLLSPMMTAFDLCDVTQPCGQRDITTVAPQALVMLNNPFIHQRGLHLAEQILSEHGEWKDRIEALWLRVYARSPRADEVQLAVRYLQTQLPVFAQSDFAQSDVEGQAAQPEALCFASLCVGLFNSNEFFYVD